MNFMDAHSTIGKIVEMYDKAIQEYESRIIGLREELIGNEKIIERQAGSIIKLVENAESSSKVEELSARIQEQAEIIAKHKNYVHKVSYILASQDKTDERQLDEIRLLKSEL